MQNQQPPQPPPQPPQPPPYPPYPPYPGAGKLQSNKVVIIVLIVVWAVGLVFVGLRVLVIIMRPPIMNQLNDMGCKNNLKAFDTALALYRNEWNQQLPPYSGVKFVAILYRCGYLTEKNYFLCPSKGGDEWVKTGPNKTSWKFEKPAPGEEYSKNWNPKFEPWEISYAGRRNDPNDAGGKFCLAPDNTEPTPLISDSTLNHQGENDAKYGPHGDHGGEVNVLLTNGSIIKLKGVAVGVKYPDLKMDLECLSNE